MMVNKRQKEKVLIRVRVFRFDPSRDAEPRYENYQVPLEKQNPTSDKKTTVLDVLKYIKANHDESLSFYASCLIPFWEARKQGRCSRAICNVFVNGSPVLTCEEPVTGEEDLLIEPPKVDTSLDFKVIKDLIAEDVMLTEKDYYFMSRQRSFNILKELGIGD